MIRSKKIILRLHFFTLVVCSFSSYSQLKQIITGTSADLYDLSVINKNIIISGSYDYLVKSNDECNNLTPLTMPGPTGNFTQLQRLDSNNMFLLYNNASQTLIYKSTDGGNNWIQKTNGSGDLSRKVSFFDTLSGMMTRYSGYYNTLDGGSNWTTHSFSFQFAVNSINTYGDSTVIIGGVSVPSAFGTFYLSKNRGQTWSNGWGLGGLGKGPTDFFFLNKDTIFGVSEDGGFTKTIDGGNNWDGLSEPPITNSNHVYFKNAKEGYVLGNNNQNLGLILKTTDFGKTWNISFLSVMF